MPQSGDASLPQPTTFRRLLSSGPNSVTGNLTGTSALIARTTNEMTTAQVKWGTASGVYDSQTSVNGALVADHAIRILGPVPQTTLLCRSVARCSRQPDHLLGAVLCHARHAATGHCKCCLGKHQRQQCHHYPDDRRECRYPGRLRNDNQLRTASASYPLQIRKGNIPHGRVVRPDGEYAVSFQNPFNRRARQYGVVDDFTFTTTDITPPVIVSGPAISNNTGTSAVITWTTDEPSTTQIAYGPTSSYGNTTTFSGSYVLTHRQTVVNITPKSTVNFQMRSRDAAGNILAAPNATFVATSPIRCSRTSPFPASRRTWLSSNGPPMCRPTHRCTTARTTRSSQQSTLDPALTNVSYRTTHRPDRRNNIQFCRTVQRCTELSGYFVEPDICHRHSSLSGSYSLLEIPMNPAAQSPITLRAIPKPAHWSGSGV